MPSPLTPDKLRRSFDRASLKLKSTADNEMHYATFIATRSRDEGLQHLERVAVGRVIEYGSRLAGTQNKLTTRFGNISDLVREANYWATATGRELVSVEDVDHAIDQREFLGNRIETRMRENLIEGK